MLKPSKEITELEFLTSSCEFLFNIAFILKISSLTLKGFVT